MPAALEMAIGQCSPSNVIHHSDSGTRCTSLAAAAAKPACAHPWDLSVTPDFVATLIFLWAQR